MRKGAKITLGVVGAVIVVGIIAGATGSDSKSTAKPAASAPAKPASKDEPAAASQADQFKAFVAKEGTPTEKAAVQHVTKVQGAEVQNNILDAPEVFTDYTGGMMGPHASDGKLIASAFADWKHSKNGVVTVYDKAGEILSNGQL